MHIFCSIMIDLFITTLERNRYLEERNEELERQVDVWGHGMELPCRTLSEITDWILFVLKRIRRSWHRKKKQKDSWKSSREETEL